MKKTRKQADEQLTVPHPVPLATPASKIDIKKLDPVRSPAGSTTEEDIARADGEGMAPVPVPDPPAPPKRA